MKKICLLITILALTLNCIYAEQIKPWVDPVKSIFEITGGIDYISMGEYNSGQEQIAEDEGKLSSLNTLHLVPGFDIAYTSIFQSPIGLWAITSRFGMLIASDTESLIKHSVSKNAIEFNNNMAIDYVGFGARKYFAYMWEAGKPNGFVGLNIELGTSVAHSFLSTEYDISGNEIGTISCDPNGVFFGGSFEVGGDYWFTEYIGMVLKGGYRYLKGNAAGTYSGTGTYADMHTDTFDETLDYSGPYALLGVAFSFETAGAQTVNVVKEDNVKSPGGVPQLPGGQSRKLSFVELVKYGNNAYKSKNYTTAITHFEEAVKAAPSADIYRKLGMSYYYMKNKEKAVLAFEQYLNLNPSDTAMQKWLESFR